jgi:hypothetical protein
MIIWLNGTFGSGKTSIAGELHSLVPMSRVFDPETVGYMLAPNLADRPVADFQHWPPWRPLVAATATELARFTGQHLIAPQTIMVRAYLEGILFPACATRGWRSSMSCSTPPKTYYGSASRAPLKHRAGVWIISPSTGDRVPG